MKIKVTTSKSHCQEDKFMDEHCSVYNRYLINICWMNIRCICKASLLYFLFLNLYLQYFIQKCNLKISIKIKLSLCVCFLFFLLIFSHITSGKYSLNCACLIFFQPVSLISLLTTHVNMLIDLWLENTRLTCHSIKLIFYLSPFYYQNC